jgi:glycyl-tRNA synthetase beta chain
VGTPVRDLEVSEEGNGRVLQARLADARFFWQEDLKVPLEEWAAQLEDVTFQAKLGSVKDKADRVAKIGVELAPLFGADTAVVEKAGRLCKADLATHMVGEFPELQGVMGREYARAGGLGEEVALAIWEHYKPRGATDELPETAAGAVLSVADRLDTIVGCIGAGLKPKGRGDPFALRRAALGMVRIGIDRKVRLNMEEVVGKAAERFDPAVRPEVSEVTDFLLERLRSFLGEDASGDVVRAVMVAGGTDLDDLASRVRAVTSLQGSEVFAILATAFRRTVNIFKQATVEVGKLTLDPAKLVEKEEKELHDKLTEVLAEVKGLLARADYTPALERMAALGPFVDVFFDNVRVLDAPEDLSKNRLALLTLVDNLFRRIADFKIIASE